MFLNECIYLTCCICQVIHTHFWLKRNEICTQIENWIEELSKPQYSERNSRTISFNSMVLRRQYRHLREELAKLKVPEGLEDLDTPFNPNVNLPAMTETTSAANTTNTKTTSTTATSTASTTVATAAGSKSGSSADNNGNGDNSRHESEDKNVNASSNSVSATTPTATGSRDSNSSTVTIQIPTPTNAPLANAEWQSIPNQLTAQTSESISSSASATTMALTTLLRQSMPVEVSNDFDSMNDATMVMAPQPPVPVPVTAKVSTVEVATAPTAEDEDADEDIQIDASEYNYNADLVQSLFYTDDSQFENSNLGDFME